MSEWKEYRLGDLIESVSKTFKFGDTKVYFLNTSDTLEGKVINHELFKPEDLPGQAKKSIKLNDILYSEIRPANKRYAFVDFNPDNYVVSTKLMVLRIVETTIVIPKYLYYYLTSNETIDLLQFLAESRSGTFPQIRFEEVSHLSISLPTIPIQEQIVELISSLDDKIELNNKINQELENLAQTLFKQWFIDFEFPNENGEPYKSSGGEMVDSELGEIPKGWEVYRFKEIVSKYIDNRGKTPPIANDGIPLVEVRQMVDTGIYPSLRTDKFLSKEVYDTFLRGHLLKDDILMSTVGTIGRLNIVPDFQIFAIAQNVLGIRFNKDLTSQFFMFCLMRTKDFNDEINSRLIETVQSSIKRSDLEKIPVILPKLILVERFDSLIRDIFDRIKNSALEIEELTNLRDILLSKLISGELHVTSKKTNTNYKLS